MLVSTALRTRAMFVGAGGQRTTQQPHDLENGRRGHQNKVGGKSSRANATTTRLLLVLVVFSLALCYHAHVQIKLMSSTESALAKSEALADRRAKLRTTTTSRDRDDRINGRRRTKLSVESNADDVEYVPQAPVRTTSLTQNGGYILNPAHKTGPPPPPFSTATAPLIPGDTRRHNRPPPMPVSHIFQGWTANSRQMVIEWASKADDVALRYYGKSRVDVGYVVPRPASVKDEKFLTFEWINGGQNNIKQSIETLVVMASLLERTLVLPPPTVDPHRHQESVADQLQHWNLAHIKAAVPTISFAEFEALQRGGEFPPVYPVSQPRPFASESPFSVNMHDEWNHLDLERTAKIVDWNMWQYITCIPGCPTTAQQDNKYFSAFRSSELGVTPVKSVADDLDDNRPRIIHMPQNQLGFFYRVLYVAPAKRKAVTKLVRDGVVFHNTTFAYAANHVQALGEHDYNCLHLRRGDWQEDKGEVVSMADVANNIRPVLGNTKTLFVATNEKNRSKFDSLGKALGVTLKFFDMNMATENGKWDAPSPAMLPTVEQLVCSRARVFVGTLFSTFSSTIQRTRGYYKDTPDKHVYYADSSNKLGVDRLTDERSPSSSASSSSSSSLAASVSSGRLPSPSTVGWGGNPKPKRPPSWAQEYPEAWMDLQGPED